MIRHMFVFGVILPTLVTILLFVAFLICWFKFNMHERLFSKRKLFSKQLKHAMAPGKTSLPKPNQIYTADQSSKHPAAPGSGKDRDGSSSSGGNGKGSKTINAISGGNIYSNSGTGVLSRKPARYENCLTSGSTADDEDDMHEHSVGDDPEAALCSACEDEVMHACHSQSTAGFSNPNLCTSPTHSSIANEEAILRNNGHQEEPEDDVEYEDEDPMHSDPEDVNMDAQTEYVQVKQVGSMFQHTFHFPASECSHLSNSLVGDSEDGGSEDGNYGHFVPISQLLRDPKARQFYAAARSESPAGADLSDGSITGNGGMTMGVSCSESGRLISGM